MRIDLHTHSHVSDGTQHPADLVRAAAEAGLDVLGLTDHDTTDGWEDARRAARDVGITLVPGVELSTVHEGRGVHLLAYLPDPEHPGLVETMASVRRGRAARVPVICARLREMGIDLAEEDVRRHSSATAATGRPHVADALVEQGVVRDRAEAFDRYLKPGRPAYVDRTAADLTETIGIVADAGGVTVLAHPWGRRARQVLDGPALEALRDAGLSGVEVDHQDHTPEQRRELRGIAAELDLVVTGSSDHHGLGKSDHELGCHTTDPEQYERLLDAATSARATGTAGGSGVAPGG